MATQPSPPPVSPPAIPWQWKNCQVSGCNTNVIIAIACAIAIVALLLQLRLQQRGSQFVTTTSALMLLGGVCNAAYVLTVQRSQGSLDSATSLARSPLVHDIIYYALLPPIIFEAGFTMRKRAFFANCGAVMLLAVVGTLVAIVVAGLLLSAAVQAGLVPTAFTDNQLLLFASLISSTDPIATLGVLKALKTRPPLYDLIFGESALNDALSIVLFNLFKVACRREHASAAPTRWGVAVGRVAGQLALLVPLSVLLGLCFGLASAALTHRLALRSSRAAHLELALVGLVALASYATTDALTLPLLGGTQFSAIMALFFSAIVMRHYTFYNLSAGARKVQATRSASHTVSCASAPLSVPCSVAARHVPPAAAATSQASVVLFRTLSTVSEAALALLLGCAFVDYCFQPWAWDWAFIGAAIGATLIGRAANVFPMAWLANCGRSAVDRVTLRMQCAIWWAGLRGGVSFALVLTLDDQAQACLT